MVIDENEDIENEEDCNIFEEIQDFISFDKSKNMNDLNCNISSKKNNNNVNIFIHDYIKPINYVNDFRNINNFSYITNNIKTIKGCSPERYNDFFDPPYLVKNQYDDFKYKTDSNNTFIRNNIYKNQQFQENQIFNFHKQYEVNSFLLEPQNYPNCPPYYLQKTVPLPYNNQSQIFSNDCNDINFYPKMPNKYNQFNYYPLLKTIRNNNNSFLNNFNLSPDFAKNEQIKVEINKNTASNVTKEKKTKHKVKKKLYLKNNKLVYVINEQHTDTKDVIYLDEDSESNKEGKNVNNNKIEIIKERLSEERKPRSSKFRGVSKNGKHWQVLIMIKQKKRYIGNFSDEEEAAREYDKIAIQFHGPKAKTNFHYDEKEINSILASPKLKKLSNLF
jgi:hypothetical protein